MSGWRVFRRLYRSVSQLWCTNGPYRKFGSRRYGQRRAPNVIVASKCKPAALPQAAARVNRVGGFGCCCGFEWLKTYAARRYFLPGELKNPLRMLEASAVAISLSLSVIARLKLRRSIPARSRLGAVLATVKDAARRLRRWPAAILDRRCARRRPAILGRDGTAALSRTEKLLQRGFGSLRMRGTEAGSHVCHLPAREPRRMYRPP